MEIRTHTEYLPLVVNTNYIVIEDGRFMYLVHADQADSIEDGKWRLQQNSVLTINMNTKAVVKSRFF